MMARLFFSLMGSASVVIGIGAFFFVTALMMPAADFGMLASSYALASLLGVVVNYGYPQKLLREAGHGATGGTIPREVLRLQALLALVATVPGVGYALLGGGEVGLFVVLWLGTVPLTYANTLQAMFRAHHLHRQDAALRGLGRLSMAVLIAGAALSGVQEPLVYAALFTASAWIELALTWRAFRTRFAIGRPAAAPGWVRRDVSGGFVYFVDVLMQRIFGTVDVILVSAFASPAEAGTYIIAQKFAQLFLIALQAIMNTQVGQLAQAQRQDRTALKPAIRRLRLLAAGNGVLGLVGMGVVSLPGVLGLFGPDYVAAGTACLILGVAVLLRSVAAGDELTLMAIGLQRVRVRVNLGSAALLVGLAPVLILWGGDAGAALAILIVALATLIALRIVTARAFAKEVAAHVG